MISEANLATAHSVATLGNECATLVSYLPKSYKAIERECIESIFNQISQDESIPYVDRLHIVTQIPQLIKHSKNQKTIMEIANKYLSIENDETITHQPIDEDWFDYFLEESKIISTSNAQEIWGKILAEECKNPNSIRKSLIFTLKTLDKSTANSFQKLNNLSFELITSNGIIESALCIFPKELPLMNLTYEELLDLKSTGLIDINEFYSHGYKLPKHETSYIRYFDEKITIDLLDDEYNDLLLGYVFFTENGNILSKIIEKEKQPELINYVMNKISSHYKVQTIQMN